MSGGSGKTAFFHHESGQCGADVEQCAGLPVHMHGNHAVHIVKYPLFYHVLLSGEILNLPFRSQLLPVFKLNKLLGRRGDEGDPSSRLPAELHIIQHFQHIGHDGGLMLCPQEWRGNASPRRPQSARPYPPPAQCGILPHSQSPPESLSDRYRSGRKFHSHAKRSENLIRFHFFKTRLRVIKQLPSQLCQSIFILLNFILNFI